MKSEVQVVILMCLFYCTLAVNEIKYLFGLARDIGMEIVNTTAYTDALTVLHMINQHNLQRRTRHMATKIAY